MLCVPSRMRQSAERCRMNESDSFVWPQIPCAYETLVPEAVRSHDNLTIQWVYPSAGTIATRDGVPDIAEQTRYERREHREVSPVYIPSSEILLFQYVVLYYRILEPC